MVDEWLATVNYSPIYDLKSLVEKQFTIECVVEGGGSKTPYTLFLSANRGKIHNDKIIVFCIGYMEAVDTAWDCVADKPDLVAIIGRIVDRVDKCAMYGPAGSAREAIDEGRAAIKEARKDAPK